VEAPHLATLHNKYHDRGFTVLAVNSWDEDAKTVAKFVKDMGLSFPVLLNGSDVTDDWGVWSWPANFLIDRQGRVAQEMQGIDENDLPHLEESIERLLQ